MSLVANIYSLRKQPKYETALFALTKYALSRSSSNKVLYRVFATKSPKKNEKNADFKSKSLKYTNTVFHPHTACPRFLKDSIQYENKVKCNIVDYELQIKQVSDQYLKI